MARWLTVFILFISTQLIQAQYDEDTVTVTTCCEHPLTRDNVTWCDGIYSQSENIHFKYGSLECDEVTNATFSAGNVWEGHGFFPNYFLKYEDRFYPPSDYCLRSLNEDKIDVKICKPQCELEKLCLPKCCNLWDDVSFVNNTIFCVPSLEEKIWKPDVYNADDYHRQVALKPGQLHFFVHDPSKTSQCTTVRLIQYQHFDYKILNNGQVQWTSSDVLDWYKIPERRFCLDREMHEGSTLSETVVLVGCLEDFIPTITDNLTLVDTINFIFNSISLGFLALTLVIYILLRSHQNVHSWTQFSYFLALWCNLLWTSIMYYETREDSNNSQGRNDEDDPSIERNGVLRLILSAVGTFLHNSALTTMVALAVDVFSMFHQLLGSGEQKTSKADFIKNQSVAWGLSFCIVMAGLCLYLSNGSVDGFVSYKAKFWLADEILEAVCHLLTVSLFLITLIRIGLIRMNGKEEFLKVNEQRNYSRALSLLFKLLVVMGLTWSSILLNYLFVKSTVHVIKWIFALVEFSVSLQGFVIFLMFAFNKETLDSLGENYSILRKLSNASSISTESGSDIPESPVTVSSTQCSSNAQQG